MINARSLLLCGDWAPGARDVKSALLNPSIINIEGPILPFGSQESGCIAKAGPLLFSVNLPFNGRQSVAILANNHLFDFGIRGYEITRSAIEDKEWLTVGAGLSSNEAIAPVFFDWYGKRVAVLARCETQFGVAQIHKAGVAKFDATIFGQIRQLKREADIVIASIHAAAEMLPWPSPTRQDTWRALIDAGADIVHGHHAHVPQGWEEYNGGWIFYGLGNFCVDPAKWSWHPNGLWSLTPELSYASEKIQVDFKTSVIEEQGDKIHVRESTYDELSQHSSYLDVCNKPLSDCVLLEGLWQQAAIRMYEHHYADWLGFKSSKKTIYQSMRSVAGKMKRFLAKNSALNPERQKYLLHYHLFACESHNEAIQTALGLLGGELDDLRTLETRTLVDKWMIDR